MQATVNDSAFETLFTRRILWKSERMNLDYELLCGSFMTVFDLRNGQTRLPNLKPSIFTIDAHESPQSSDTTTSTERNKMLTEHIIICVITMLMVIIGMVW